MLKVDGKPYKLRRKNTVILDLTKSPSPVSKRVMLLKIKKLKLIDHPSPVFIREKPLKLLRSNPKELPFIACRLLVMLLRIRSLITETPSTIFRTE